MATLADGLKRAPEVEVIAQGKARAPYDGHTLAEELEQARILSNATIKDVYVDLGYRGVGKCCARPGTTFGGCSV